VTTVPTWKVIGDNVVGTSHSARATLCQDAFRCRAIGPDHTWLAIAVADGAGSSTHSEIGANLACDEFMRLAESMPLGSFMDREGAARLYAEVRGSLLREAERLGVNPRELACTALFCMVGPAGGAFAQLGDGAIVLSDEAEYRAVFWPEPAEYANATDFLTDERFADALLFSSVEGSIKEIALMTDGLQRLALDFTSRKPHAAFFRPLFARLKAEANPELLFEPLRAFLDSPRVNDRTDDDKTLILAVPAT
jgi:hypothetical protein